MKRLTLVLVAGLFGTGCLQSTQGTEVGIKINRLFGDDSIIEPGRTVVVIPLIHDWYVYDGRLQVLEMKEQIGAKGQRISDDDLDFKTVDGNDIGVDITIQWRIDPKKAHELLREVGPSMDQIADTVVRPMARSIPRDALNELSSEDFYDSRKRAAKEALAHRRLDEALREHGIFCEKVILQDYRFQVEYQNAIDAKKVADQQVNKNRSAAEAARREWARELEKTKGEVAQKIATEMGRAEQAKLKADAYYEARKLEAEAILAERQAQAKGMREKRAAIAGSGGRTMVKLKIAEALKGKRIVLIPMGAGGFNLQKTDINALLTTMGVDALSKGKSQ